MLTEYLNAAFADAIAAAPRALRAEYRRRAPEWQEMTVDLLHEMCAEATKCQPDAAAADAVRTAWRLLTTTVH